MTIAPWLQAPNVLQIAQAGTQAGLGLRHQNLAEATEAQQAQQAADLLNFHYQQLQAEQQQKQSELAQHAEATKAAQAFHIMQEKALELHRNALEAHQLTQEEQAANASNTLTNWRQNSLTEQNRHNLSLEAKPTALKSDMDFAAQLKDSALKLRSSGDIEEAKKAEYQLSLIEGKLLGPNETIESVTPEGAITRVIRGGKSNTGNDLTTGAKTKLQEDLSTYDAPIATIGQIERNMKSSDFGLAGTVGEFMDRYGAQVKPELADPRRESVRNALRFLRADLYKSLRSDSNITKAEQEQIARMLPSDSLGESLPRAAQMLVDTRNELVKRARDKSQRLGVIPPKWAMTPKEIGAAWKTGAMSEVDATEALKKYFPQLIPQQ